MSTCTGCNRPLPFAAFAWKNRATGHRHARCRDCQNTYTRGHYARTAAARRVQIREREHGIVAEMNAWVEEQMVTAVCARCGSLERLVVLDVRQREGRPLSRMIQEGYSPTRIRAAYARAQAAGRVVCEVCCGVETVRRRPR